MNITNLQILEDFIELFCNNNHEYYDHDDDDDYYDNKEDIPTIEHAGDKEQKKISGYFQKWLLLLQESIYDIGPQRDVNMIMRSILL